MVMIYAMMRYSQVTVFFETRQVSSEVLPVIILCWATDIYFCAGLLVIIHKMSRVCKENKNNNKCQGVRRDETYLCLSLSNV